MSQQEEFSRRKSGADCVGSIYHGQSVFRSHGFYYKGLNLPEKSVRCFDAVNKLDPSDGKTIVGRGHSNLLSAKYKEALKDALSALDLDEKDIHALYLRAVALFESGKFEDSLLFFHRGYKDRKQPPYYEAGILAAEGTVDDCIGPNVGPILHEFLGVIRKMQEAKRKKHMEDKLRYVTKEETVKPTDDAHIYWDKVKLEKVRSKRYLGHAFAEDVEFLEKLLKDPDISSANKDNSERIINNAKESLDLLFETKEALRERSPYYVLKYKGISSREVQKRRRNMALINKIEITKVETEKMFEKLLRERSEQNIKAFLELMDKTKTFLDETPTKLLPKKSSYLDTLYNTCALMFTDRLKLVPDISAQRQILLYFGLSTFIAESRDNVVADPTSDFTDYKQLLHKCEGRLRLATSDLEKAWLHHEMARAQLELGAKLDSARSHAKKCLNYAKLEEHLAWSLLACMMLCKVDLRSGNRHEARSNAQDAEEFARNLKEPEIIQFITECYNVIETAPHTDENVDIIGRRENKIVTIMANPEMRSQALGLFSHIANQPRKKRMSIVPGISYLGRKNTKNGPDLHRI